MRALDLNLTVAVELHLLCLRTTVRERQKKENGISDLKGCKLSLFLQGSVQGTVPGGGQGEERGCHGNVNT